MDEPELWRIGTILGDNYRLDSVIGTGSVGTVFKGWHLVLGKTIAIKVIYAHLLENRTAVKRFEREARAASFLSHPNCLEILDFGQDADGTMFLVMEYVDGCDLATLLSREFPFTQERVVRIVRQIAEALDLAHEQGVIHRDLKLENVMVTQAHQVYPDMVKVLDFGIAKLLTTSSVGQDSFETLSGMVPGTPQYMSPEHARGEDLDGRSDLYALGILLYELLTGRVPFDSSSPMRIIEMHLNKEPTRPSELFPGIFQDLEALILECLSKDREERPAKAADVAARLAAMEDKFRLMQSVDEHREWEEAPPTIRPTLETEVTAPAEKSHPWPMILIILALVGIGVALALWLL